MSEITLTLTRDEANALDALVNTSAKRLFTVEDGGKDYALETWSLQTAAQACDKLRQAVLGEQSPQTWSAFLARNEPT